MITRYSSLGHAFLALAIAACLVTPQPAVAQFVGGGGGGIGGLGGGGGSDSEGGSAITNSSAAYGKGSSAGSGNGEQSVNIDFPLCRVNREDGTITPDNQAAESLFGSDTCLGSCGDSSTIEGGDGASSFGLVGSGGSSSCSTCSGGGSSRSGGLGSDFSAADLRRMWKPYNRYSNSSFSPGYYSQFDSQLEIFPDSGSTSIAFFDVMASRVYIFDDGIGDDVQDGVFYDTRNNHALKMEMFDSAGAITSNASSAAEVVVTHRRGATETFEIIDLNASPTEQTLAARLTKRTNLDGRGLTITYKSWTQAELDTAPDRQWQIDSVSDDAGVSLAFTYEAQQQGGDWAVSNVTRNDGATIDFAYASDHLISATFDDGSQATYTYGQDTEAQTATLTVFDPMAAIKERTIHVTNESVTLDVDGQAQVVNQPLGVFRMVVSVW